MIEILEFMINIFIVVVAVGISATLGILVLCGFLNLLANIPDWFEEMIWNCEKWIENRKKKKGKHV
jgi:hypothetical protein